MRLKPIQIVFEILGVPFQIVNDELSVAKCRWRTVSGMQRPAAACSGSGSGSGSGLQCSAAFIMVPCGVQRSAGCSVQRSVFSRVQCSVQQDAAFSVQQGAVQRSAGCTLMGHEV